jgi:hypothetical protein
MYEKWVDGEESVEGEMRITADFSHEAHRDWCETIVVRANHDRHLDQWLNEAGRSKAIQERRLFHKLRGKLLSEIKAGNRDFNVCEWALRNVEGSIPEAIRFLGEDESYVICKEHGGGIECGLHGDLGVNGSRGSTRGLRKLGRRVNKDHDHTASVSPGRFGPAERANSASRT